MAMGYVCANFSISTICGFIGSAWSKMCSFGVFGLFFADFFAALKELFSKI